MIRLASYNIRKAVGLDWRRDPFRTARVIAALDADIVALQEADKRLGNRPAALPPEAVAETGLVPLAAADGPSLGWHGNAVLLRPHWRAREVHRVNLPGVEPRGALVAEIDTPAGPLILAATHLGLDRFSRQRQIRAILDAIGPDRAERAVIAGDLNEWSPTRGMRPLERDFDVVAPGPSFHAARPVAPLDRVALGRRWQALEGGVFDAHLALRASDHLPVWVRIAPVTDRRPGTRSP